MQHNHTLARELIKGALARHANQDARDGDAQLIVMGAILEEFTVGRCSVGLPRVDLIKVGMVVGGIVGGLAYVLRYFKV